MEGHRRFFIVGLLVIGLVGVYAKHHEVLSAQQSKESLLTIENAAPQPALGDEPRIIKKRSNPNVRGPAQEPQQPLDLSMKHRVDQQAVEAERMRQNALRSQQARRQRQDRERVQRMNEARRKQQQQRDELIQQQLAAVAARLDALNRRYQEQQQRRRYDSRRGPSRSSRGQGRGFRPN